MTGRIAFIGVLCGAQPGFLDGFNPATGVSSVPLIGVGVVVGAGAGVGGIGDGGGAVVGLGDFLAGERSASGNLIDF